MIESELSEKQSLGPSFIGVGAAKTGTTWLYSSLSLHPNIDLPPMKEIGYLYGRTYLDENQPLSLYFSRHDKSHWYYRSRRRELKQHVRAHFAQLIRFNLNFKEFLWDIRYALFRHTDSWYRNLFEGGKCSGDITPIYCELTEDDIVALKKDFGDKKILFTMRDPVEREWSRAKMNLCKKRNLTPDQIDRDSWVAHFEMPDKLASNDYVAIYDRWAQVFGEKNVMLIYFDEIIADGWSTYHKICDFLGVEGLPDDYIDKINRPANVGINTPIPKWAREYLLGLHRGKINQLSIRFPDHPYPMEWIKKHETALET